MVQTKSRRSLRFKEIIILTLQINYPKCFSTIWDSLYKSIHRNESSKDDLHV